MDWEAFFAVGAVMLVLAVVLLVPGVMLGRRLSKRSSNAFLTGVVNKRLGVLATIFVLLFVAAAAARYFAPTSFIGQWTATGAGFYSFIAVLVVLVTVIEKLLQACGIELLDDGKNNR